jgi:hypothetical protein
VSRRVVVSYTPMAHRSAQRDLTAWLDSHGYQHSHARKQSTTHPYAMSAGKRDVEPQWSGMCPTGKHGLDYEGQPCDVCAHNADPNLKCTYRNCRVCPHKQHVHSRKQKTLTLPAADQLSVATFPTGVAYADRTRERNGDYLRLAFLPFQSLELEWAPRVRVPPEMRRLIIEHADRLRARRGEDYQVSTAGQTVKLGHARIIHQPPTGRPVFAAHERDHHITTSGRRALDRDQFALPPGPEEKRRGIGGRLPIDTIERARNALQRASQMQKRGHISAGQLAEIRRAVHRAWPSIGSSAHATMRSGNFKTTEKPFTEADVARLARQALARSHGNIAKAGQYAANMADRYESHKWERVMDYLLRQSK